MADACGSSGVFSRVAVDATQSAAALNLFTSADQAFPIAGADSLRYEQAHVNPRALTGFASQFAELTRKGLESVNGELPVMVTPETLEFFMPYVTGQAWQTGVTVPQTTPPGYFHALVHRDAALYIYDALRVNTCSISGTSGEPLQMSFGCIGRTRPAPTQSIIATVDQWPSGLNVDRSPPYMFEDVAITVEGEAVEVRSFQINHNNNLVPVYFNGSTKMCGVQRNGLQETTLELNGKHTWDMITDLMRGASPPGGLDVVMTLTHPTAGISASFRFQCWQVPERDPAGAEGEILLPVLGTARHLSGGDSDGAEWIITNDDTPT
jgi:hypothetical protein